MIFIRTPVIARQIKGLTDALDFDISEWPSIDEGALSTEARDEFLARKRAVLLYLDGQSEAIIRKTAGIGIKQVYRLIRERCIQVHPDGRIYGWRALIKHTHINDYKRKRPIKVDKWGYGAAGALSGIFDQYPDLKRKFNERILASASPMKLSEARKPRQANWKWLLNQLRDLGVEQRKEWPFNTATCGYSSIRKYIEEVLVDNPGKAAGAVGGKDLDRKMRAGDGTERPVLKPFQRVEVDAHKLDGRFCVMIPQPGGGWEPKIVHRLWVVVILEVAARAVLGYQFAMGREVCKQDILRAIKHALTKWTPMTLTFSDNAYKPGAGFPSSFDERFIGACWDEFSVDGALANTCETVATQLNDVVGATILSPKNSYAKRRSKDDRPYIETFFRTLGTRGFQRLSNTTGGKPSEKYGNDPDKVAITSQFQIEYAAELLDVLIANYNARPHGSLSHRTPLAYLDFLTSQGRAEVRYADPERVQNLLSVRKLVTVLGGYQTGRRPYINFYRASYSSDWLDNRHDLVGSKVWATNFMEEDARFAQVSTVDGVILGNVRARPPWHLTPHSLRVRQAICSLESKKLLYLASTSDAIMEFIGYVESQPKKKLPIHPAYLEIQAILAHHANSYSLPPTEPQESEMPSTVMRGKLTGERNENGATTGSESKEQIQSSLPPRRKATQK